VIAVIKQANPALPLFLYGHSLGGLVVLTLTYDYLHLNVSGVMLTSPLLGFPKDRRLPWLKRQLVKLVGKKMEDFVANSMINPTALTKSNKHIQTIFGDRLMIPFLSVKMGRSILMNVEKVQDFALMYNTPVLIVHGKNDSVTSYHDSVDFMVKISSRVKLLQHD
jgi:acylglycerol lipase